jgi:hypothetical protein
MPRERLRFLGHDLFHRAVTAKRPTIPGCNVARRQWMSLGLVKSS